MNATLGRLFLLPVPIADGAWDTLPAQAIALAKELRYLFVENLRTSRRHLKGMHPDLVIDERQFSEMDKHEGPDLKQLESWLKAGYDVGVLSEAGCPGVADPGAELAAAAHKLGATVVPVAGPSSILLALMASGMNGQRFAFQGYLPVKNPERRKQIQLLEAQSKKEGMTQIFIETPYRNNAMLDDLLQGCSGSTRICIALGLTGEKAWVQTRTVENWNKNARPELPKEPAVFLFLAT